jgi:hypothetical protein
MVTGCRRAQAQSLIWRPPGPFASVFAQLLAKTAEVTACVQLDGARMIDVRSYVHINAVLLIVLATA